MAKKNSIIIQLIETALKILGGLIILAVAYRQLQNFFARYLPASQNAPTLHQ